MAAQISNAGLLRLATRKDWQRRRPSSDSFRRTETTERVGYSNMLRPEGRMPSPCFDRALSLARPPVRPKRSAYGLAGLRSSRASESEGWQRKPRGRSKPRLAAGTSGGKRCPVPGKPSKQPEGVPRILSRTKGICLHQALKKSNHFPANGTVTFPFCLTNGSPQVLASASTGLTFQPLFISSGLDSRSGHNAAVSVRGV